MEERQVRGKHGSSGAVGESIAEKNRRASMCVYGNALLLVAVAWFFLLSPFFEIRRCLKDAGLQDGGIPGFAYRWHKGMSTPFARWARNRVTSGRAAELDIQDISGTEWPIFSCVYYLWSTEALHDQWVEKRMAAQEAPAVYADEAIRAAAALVADPNHAAWVKKHWGEDYLHEQNIFYRMLLISGLTSFQKLTGDHRYEELLSNQVDSLAEELEASPHGLLDDYPNQCYPVDVLPAYAAIQRAGHVLDRDYSAFVTKGVRAFSGERLDPLTELPVYLADPRSGRALGPTRGVGISYMLIWAPELWPEVSRIWYPKFERHFWQAGPMIAGVREFAHGSGEPEWLVDVDAGPVVAGLGTAASAFAIGAARANGRLDHAHALSSEALAVSWPLCNGTLLGPRLLSNATDAPYLGEAAMLFNFTRTPGDDAIVAPLPGPPPAVVWGLQLLYCLLGAIWIAAAGTRIRRWEKKEKREASVPGLTLQLLVWLLLGSVVISAFLFHAPKVALCSLLLMLLFPLKGRRCV